MKRYLLFTGYTYYPRGGWRDFQSSYDTIDEATGALLDVRDFRGDVDWWHVVDTETGQIVTHEQQSLDDEFAAWLKGKGIDADSLTKREQNAFVGEWLTETKVPR